ncbi:MAG: endolytic transglycosylase MltG [Chitinophagales bacterium]|nr:endolytic transglycosylase MltG [Chitinophagales bacterium]
MNNDQYQAYYSTTPPPPPEKPKKRRKKRLGLFFLLVLVVFGAIGAYIGYKIWGPNTGNMPNGQYLYIPTGASYQYVLDELEQGEYVYDIQSFDLLAHEANYPDLVKSGRYKIPHGMSNYDLIRLLRSGQQEPVKLVLNKLRTKQDLIKAITSTLEPDSAQIAGLLNSSSYLQKHGVDTNSVMAIIIPDTYEFYWNTSADGVLSRLASYYDKFWNDERKQKAFSKHLTPVQVMILASIVEEETNKNDEKPNVASVYLNRLRYHMKLQADPTVKFAMQDFGLKRILNIHLETDSRYNTYMYEGLPPGPIATPSKSSILAVLNAPETDYIYFCAKEDLSGYHNFASNYTQHMKNARAYQRALNERGIR